ncbi:hypothetical protein niasHT_025629 [Heterodera trifolii]|uniref:Uncharacterized protein n=1 Tax=Heterodera trifolii TaxID=157864 RepID=A0ABD2KI32_9BILA
MRLFQSTCATNATPFGTPVPKGVGCHWAVFPSAVHGADILRAPWGASSGGASSTKEGAPNPLASLLSQLSLVRAIACPQRRTDCSVPGLGATPHATFFGSIQKCGDHGRNQYNDPIHDGSEPKKCG